MHNRRISGRGELVTKRVTGVAFGAADAHLDQLVRRQCTFDFFAEFCRHAGMTNREHRLEGMRPRFQVRPLTSGQ